MFFQSYLGELNPQVGHENPRAEERAQIMQLSKVQLAPIVSSAASLAPTQQKQHTGNNPPLATAANHVTRNTAVVQ